jgi:hypothetical protein
VVTQREVLDLVESGVSYDDAAARLSISAGLAYMIATGLPADGSDAVAGDGAERPGALRTSTQYLANPARVENPAHRDEVQQWIDARVRNDTQMQQAGAADVPTVPPLGATGDDADIVAVLARDHDQFHQLTKQLQVIPTAAEGGAPDQLARRVAIVDALRVALARHDAAEEQHFWPVVFESFADHAQRQAGERSLHQTLDAFDGVEGGSQRFEELTTELATQLRAHIAFEDRVCLQLRDRMAHGERASLGERLAAAERSADGSA